MSAKIFYRPEYACAGASFDTTRKSAWIAESLQRNPIAHTTLVAPALLTEEQLVEVHSPAYVNAIKTGAPAQLASSSGFSWDEGMWIAVRASNGGAVAAALAAFRTARRAHYRAGCITHDETPARAFAPLMGWRSRRRPRSTPRRALSYSSIWTLTAAAGPSLC